MRRLPYWEKSADRKCGKSLQTGIEEKKNDRFSGTVTLTEGCNNV